MSLFKESDVTTKLGIYEMQGYSGAFCKCGNTLYIKTPKHKGWHNIECPHCKFVVQLFCGEKKCDCLEV